MHNFQSKIKNHIKIIQLFMIFFITLIFTNCSALFFEDFSVTDFSYNQEYIAITFSSDINEKSIINSFSFLQDEILIDGQFQFSNQKVLFYPVSKIEKNHLYKVSISTEAESTNGISLSDSYTTSFSTKENETLPKILNFEITNSKIKILFNTSIQKENFSNEFSIQPNIKTLDIWNEDSTAVELIFLEPLTENTKYIIEISKNLKNIFNNSLSENFNYLFENKIDKITTNYDVFFTTKNEEILLSEFIENKNLENDFLLNLNFDKNIKKETVSQNIIFTPPLNFEIDKNSVSQNQIKINILEKPKYNSTYKLLIDKNILDINSNKIKSKEFLLTFNNEQIKPINFVCGFIDIKDSILNFSTDTVFEEINFNPKDFPTQRTPESEIQNISIVMIFDISKSAKQISDFSFMENFQIATTQNCISIIPKKVKIISTNDFLTNTEFSKFSKNFIDNFSQGEINNKNFSIAIIESTVENNDSTGLLKFNLSKNLTDDIGNTLENDIEIIFNKN